MQNKLIMGSFESRSEANYVHPIISIACSICDIFSDDQTDANVPSKVILLHLFIFT